MSRLTPRHLLRGVVLIEALVALLIVAFAIVALGGVQANFIRSADLARQRGDALRLAQQDLESLRHYISLEGAGNSFAAIGSAVHTLHATDRDLNTDYLLTRDVQAAENGRAAAVRVTVAWQHRAGEQQQVRLDSLIHRAEPALGCALSQAPAQTRFAVGGRHPEVPPTAVNLGDGRSAYSPAGEARIVWLFNNATGALVSRCSLASGHGDKASDLSDCIDIANGYLLSGTVGFSTSALPLSFDLVLTSKGHLQQPSFECTSIGLASRSRVDYDCIVYGNTDAPPIWSGTLDLAGLAFDGIKAVKVCRYSADYDGDGFIGNAEHPEQYVAVSRGLRNQNFLVIPAAEDCPAGHGIDPDRGWFTNTATVLHQDAKRPSHRGG